MTGRLKDKIAVVTGAARGIGAEVARTFLTEGARLAVLDIDHGALEQTARSWGNGDADMILTKHADIADQASVAAAFAAIIERFGRIDILINNAGINMFRDPLTMTSDDWRRCLAVNLEGAWHCIRASLPGMLAAKRGSIVNIASTHAFAIIPGTFPYPVAKHGLIGLTRSLAVEYAPQGVRINAVAPGYIETDKVKDWLAAFPDPAAARRRVEGLIPLRRIGSPREVAWAVVYLASDESGFTTGSVLVMDGGRSVVYHD